jgi:hypothetical protein
LTRHAWGSARDVVRVSFPRPPAWLWAPAKPNQARGFSQARASPVWLHLDNLKSQPPQPIALCRPCPHHCYTSSPSIVCRFRLLWWLSRTTNPLSLARPSNPRPLPATLTSASYISTVCRRHSPALVDCLRLTSSTCGSLSEHTFA